MNADLSFGMWLKRRRRGLGMTQVELGRRTGYSGETIRKVEAEEVRVSRAMADALVVALDIPPGDRERFLRFARNVGGEEAAPFPADTIAVPPTAPPRPRHNLPTPPTPLVGRDAEVAALTALLQRDTARLVTLTGVGGSGKTRLALDVAFNLLDGFEDGVFFVDLAPVRDPALVLATIARTLDVRETAGRPLLLALQDVLRDKSLLLLLDNFEQALDAGPMLADLLAAAPHLKLLVTSREVLHLRAEHVVPVEPLAVPPLRDLPPLDDLAAYPAVALFAERASDARPDFHLTADNGPAVAEVCTRLDGLPLAIELAAARVRLLPPPALLSRLGKGLTLVGPRDLPPRQQTLHNTIAWSYALLSAAEKALFRRLSVFVGGATLEAVEAVCNVDGDLGSDVMDGVAALVDKSLLRQVNIEGEARFTMLETIREFAVEELAESGEADALRRRHATYFVALAEQAEPEMADLRQIAWLERLEREHDNFRAALQWSLETDDALMDVAPQMPTEVGATENEGCVAPTSSRLSALDIALRLAGALGWFWYLHSHLVEGRAWLDRVLARAGRVSTATGGKVLSAAGTLAFAQGDHAAAKSLHEKALALYREVGDTRGVARALSNLGLQILAEGDLKGANVVLQEAEALFRETDDTLGLVESLNILGEVARSQGNYDGAEEYYAESLALLSPPTNNMLAAWLYHNLGHVALHRGDTTRALALFRQSFALGRKIGFKPVMIPCLAGFAAVWGGRGHAAKAARLFGAADQLLTAAHSHLDPADRIAYDRNLAAARAQLADAAFATAWEEGRAMALDAAVAYALEDAGP